MRRLDMTAAAILLAAASAAPLATAHAATYTYQTIDNQADPTFNQLLGINNAGAIAGYFGSGAAGHPNQGYLISAPYSTFRPANLPGSAQTQATGLNNNGLVTGFWSGSTGNANYGFIRQSRNGAFTYLSVNDPLVSSQPTIEQVLGVNDAGVAVGFYNDANNVSHGFSYTISTGRFAAVTSPTAQSSSAATGINNHGTISGFLANAAGRTVGFVRGLSGNPHAFVAVPGAQTTQLLGVNNANVAVGFYARADNIPHGVIYDAAAGTYAMVDAPLGAMGTALNGINDHGQVVGFYVDTGGNTHGLLVTVQP